MKDFWVDGRRISGKGEERVMREEIGFSIEAEDVAKAYGIGKKKVKEVFEVSDDNSIQLVISEIIDPLPRIPNTDPVEDGKPDSTPRPSSGA